MNALASFGVTGISLPYYISIWINWKPFQRKLHKYTPRQVKYISLV